jgi:hypothetical protein
MPQKPQPEKSGSAEEGQKHNKTASAFRVLTEKLLTVSPEELKEKEREWREARDKEH